MNNVEIVERLQSYFGTTMSGIEKELNLANGTISKFKKGTYNLPYTLIESLKQANLNVDYFLTGNGSPDNSQEMTNKEEVLNRLLKYYNKPFFQIEKILNLSNGTLGKYRDGRINLPKSLIYGLEKANLNVDYFLTGNGSPDSSQEDTQEEAPVISSAAKIPLLRQKVSCGPGAEWQSEDNVEKYIEPIRQFARGKVYAFHANGISMLGAGINDGDIIFFDGSTDQSVSDGIYVFGLDGEAYCKLLRFEPLENKVMVYSVQKPDLRDAELIRSIDADSDNFRIFGRVLAWLHENSVLKGR